MGRYAQRRRAGGGSPTLNSMIHVVLVGNDTLDVTYAATVNSGEFGTATFATVPTGLMPATITAIDPTKIRLGFESEIDAESGLTYSGNVIGIISPQTISIG